jgi:hypothetical protein
VSLLSMGMSLLIPALLLIVERRVAPVRTPAKS